MGIVAVDVGGTSVRAAMCGDGDISDVIRVATPKVGGSVVLDAIVSVIEQVIDLHGPASGIGLAVPGLIENGVVRYSANLVWRDLRLADVVTERCGIPVRVEHDVRSAALAEYLVGAGKGAKRMVFIGIGTGISAAVVLDGHILDGAAGQIGHGGSFHGDLCACQGRGCLEAFASATGIEKTYQSLTGKARNASEVVDAANLGDPHAEVVWKGAISALASELAGIVRLLGEVRIVVGGGLSLAGKNLFEPLREATVALLTVHPNPQILQSAFGDQAGLVGAALLFRD